MAQRNQVLSLFGATPEQIMAQQREAEASRLQGIQNPYQQVGAVIGTGLGRLFGGKSEEVQQAEQMQEALKGVDVNDPNALRSLAETVQGFAPERALQILDRATQLEDQGLSREAKKLSIEADRYTLSQQKKIDPVKMKGYELANQLSQLKLRQANNEIEDTEAAKAEEIQIKADTAEWLKGQGADNLGNLVEIGSIPADKAAVAWYEAQNKGIGVKEVGAYTLADGKTEIIGSMDKQGNLYQLTDGGWMKIPSQGVTQGAPSSDKAGGAKQGRAVNKGSGAYKSYNQIFDAIVDTGIEDITGDLDSDTLLKNIGIDTDTQAGKEELFRLAEQLFKTYESEGITEREALERAIAGERVGTPSATQQQAPSNKPNLGDVSKSKS